MVVAQANCADALSVLQAGVQQLESKDWTQAIQGLNVVRQAAVHHMQTLEPLL